MPTDRPSSPRRAALFGGSGFVGTAVAEQLLAAGWQVRIVSRHAPGARLRAKFARTPDVDFAQADIGDDSSDVANAMQGCAAIVNLTGILTESRSQSFNRVHLRGAIHIADAARRAGIDTIVQISAIGADASSPSAYARSKAGGESELLGRMPGAVILRPSIIFGPGDSFFNRFAALSRVSPFLPLIGGGHTLFQPVFVGDVAAAVVAALNGQARAGTIYELGGPQRYSFADLLRYMLKVTRRRRWLMPLSIDTAQTLAKAIEAADGVTRNHLPRSLILTRDQVASLMQDNIVSAEAEKDGRTLSGLGITPQTIEAIVPNYLK